MWRFHFGRNGLHPGNPKPQCHPASGAVSLSWSPISGATTYNLYRSTTSGGEGTSPYLTGLTGTTYSDTAVTSGTPYYYTLTAVNTAGQSGQSVRKSRLRRRGHLRPMGSHDADIGGSRRSRFGFLQQFHGRLHRLGGGRTSGSAATSLISTQRVSPATRR